MTSASLDRSSGVPLYRQIKSIVCDEILSGARSDDQPMTEEELIRRFGVSRAPVRQALKELAVEGYIYRERAKGSFPVAGLTRAVQRPDSVRVGGMVAYLRGEGLEPVSRVSDLGWIKPSREQVERYRLTTDERVLHFTRLISLEGEPFAYGRVWLRAPESFHTTAPELEETGSAFVLLERRYGIVLARAEHEAWATAAEPEVAETLAVPAGSPVLVVDATMYTKEGRLAGWRSNVHHADRFKYRFTTNH